MPAEGVGVTDSLIIGDVHLGDKAPSSRRGTYAEEILAKLRWCVIYANNPGPGRAPLRVVLAGDLFHLKVPWRTSYALVQETHEVLSAAEEGVDILPGNHDVSHDRLESLSSQPLGALSRMGNIRLLLGHTSELRGIGGIPWDGRFETDKWREVVEAKLVEFSEDPQLKVPELVVTHAPLFPPGKEPGHYYGIAPAEWAALMNAAGVRATYYGHIHDQHGSFEVDGHQFCNNGAISRGSLHEESVNRWPTVTEWHPDKLRFAPVPLPESVVKPPAEVFLFAEAAAKKHSASMTAAFEAALGNVKLANLTVEEVLAYVRAESPSPTVLRVVEAALEVAGA